MVQIQVIPVNNQGQANEILKTYEDLFMENELTKKILRSIKKDIVTIINGFEEIDETVSQMVKPEIELMIKRLQNYLVEQKTENFKLIKEIGQLEKEKNELHKSILAAGKRLDRLEQEVGFKNNLTENTQKTDNIYSGESTQNFKVTKSENS